jgi:hypothetical protein
MTMRAFVRLTGYRREGRIVFASGKDIYAG